MKCIKCNIDINSTKMNLDEYVINSLEESHEIKIVCEDCHDVNNRNKIRLELECILERSIDDYIQEMGSDRIEEILISSNNNFHPSLSHSNLFKLSVKKLFDIDTDEMNLNGSEWVISKIRDSKINNILYG